MRRCYRHATRHRRHHFRPEERPDPRRPTSRRFHGLIQWPPCHPGPSRFQFPLHRTFRRDRTNTIHLLLLSNNQRHRRPRNNNKRTIRVKLGRITAPSVSHQLPRHLIRQPTRPPQLECLRCRGVIQPWTWGTSVQWLSPCRSLRRHSITSQRPNHRPPGAPASLLLVFILRWCPDGSPHSTEVLRSTRRRSCPKPLNRGLPLSTNESSSRTIFISR